MIELYLSGMSVGDLMAALYGTHYVLTTTRDNRNILHPDDRCEHGTFLDDRRPCQQCVTEGRSP